VVRLRQIDGMPHEPQRTRSTLGAVTGPSNVEKCRETSRSSESLPPDQPRYILRLAQAVKCGADELACKPDPVAPQAHDQPHGAPGHHVKRSANREAIAKWLQVRLPTTKTKQHVSGYTQSVTDEPFLNRVP
jgi:hypothetical protein